MLPFFIRNELIRTALLWAALSGVLGGLWHTHHLQNTYEDLAHKAEAAAEQGQKNLHFLHSPLSQHAFTLAQNHTLWTEAWEQDMRRWLYGHPMKHSIRVVRCLHTQETLEPSSPRHILHIRVLAQNVHALQQWMYALLERTGPGSYVRSLSYGDTPTGTPLSETPCHITLVSSAAPLLALWAGGKPSSPQQQCAPVLHSVLYGSPERWVIRLGSEELKPDSLEKSRWAVEDISNHHLTLKRKKDGALFSWDF